MHGDYIGPTVNLAARLVAVARPSRVVVSDSIRATVDRFGFDAVDSGPLRGFPDVTTAYELQPG